MSLWFRALRAFVTDITACASAQVEVAWLRLSCRVDGREVDLNDDGGQVRAGLFMGQPWFGTDALDLMPLAFDLTEHAAVLREGQCPDRVWHSGAHLRAPHWRWAKSKAVPFVPGSVFLPVPCCRSAWTTGALRRSRMALGSPISAARNSRNL